MFSISQRFQHVSNQAVTYSIFASVFVIVTFWAQLFNNNAFALSSSVSNVNPYINLRSSRYYGSINGKPKENVKITFDLDTDLSPLFAWNTKQVFVYLTAEYNGTDKRSTKSEVTFWDRIIKNKDEAKLTLSNAKSKYSVWDIEDKLQERDLNLKLHWNIQPWIGSLVYGETSCNTAVSVPKAGNQESKRTKKNKQA